MSIVYGVIAMASDGKASFITPSGRVYLWAYGAWRFYFQFDGAYIIARSSIGKKNRKAFLASSRKVFMEKRVAFDSWDYQYMELSGTGKRMSKSRLFRRDQVAMLHQNAAVAHGEKARQRLTGYQPCITPTPFYVHKMRPPKNL